MESETQMKVTIVVGGRWHAFDLAKGLEEEGNLHRIITNYPRWYVRKWGIPSDKIVSLPLTFWVVRLIYKMGGESLMMRCQWRVHKWFAERAAKHLEGSELIHGWSQWSEPSLRWASERNVPTVLERSSSHILEQSRLLEEEHMRLGLRWMRTHRKIEMMELREYDLCKKIAVPSLFVERSFVKMHTPVDKLFRNALGVNLKEFYPPRHAPDAPNRAGLKVVYAGSLSIRKGIPDLLEGFSSSRIKDSELTLIGGMTPEIRPYFEKEVKNIKYIGHVPQAELVSHYQKAHCFVMPSIEEGMAMVQLQAMACGLPLICTVNTGGEDLLRLKESRSIRLSNGVEEFEAGYLVPVNKPNAISSCLESLACDENLWNRKRRAALDIASTALSWQDYANRAIRLYQELMSTGSKNG